MDETTLPADFNGVFTFTNWTSEDFEARWDSVHYTFPALKTTPLIIPSATPEQVQSIRKKFALELALKVWHNSDKFLKMQDVPAGGTPPLYTDSDIAPFVQKCLEPLEIGQAKVKVEARKEPSTRKDSKGKAVTQVFGLDDGVSLVGEGTVVG